MNFEKVIIRCLQSTDSRGLELLLAKKLSPQCLRMGVAKPPGWREFACQWHVQLDNRTRTSRGAFAVHEHSDIRRSERRRYTKGAEVLRRASDKDTFRRLARASGFARRAAAVRSEVWGRSAGGFWFPTISGAGAAICGNVGGSLAGEAR